MSILNHSGYTKGMPLCSGSDWLRTPCRDCKAPNERSSATTTYIFAVFFSAAGLGSQVKPPHSPILSARQERVWVVRYRHNLHKHSKGQKSGLQDKSERQKAPEKS